MLDIAQLRAKLARIDAEREPLARLIEAYDAYEAIADLSLSGGQKRDAESGSGSARPPAPPAVRPAPIMNLTISAVTEVVEAFGPLQTGQILDVLHDREALKLDTDNASNVLSARLSNSSEFASRRGQGWWFADRPWPGEEHAPKGAHENGELNGNAASSPDAGGAATPSSDSHKAVMPSWLNPPAQG